MTDIVERLRWPAYPPDPSGLMLIAADEIERLRAALKTIAHWQETQRISAPIYVMEALAAAKVKHEENSCFGSQSPVS